MVQRSKRDDILNTAGRLFLENGFQAVSMDQIAAAVPVSKPTLYAHFKDKKDLFLACIEGRCAKAMSFLQDDIDHGVNVEQTLIAFGNHFLELLLSKQALQFHRLVVGESETFPEMAELFYETGPKKMHDLLEKYLREADKQGKLKIRDASLSAEIFIAMLKGKTHLRALLGITKKEISAKEREKLAAALVSFFIRAHQN